MQLKVHFDYRELVSAMMEVKRETNKAWPDIINKTAKDVCFRAWSFTPKATKQKMQKWLQSPLIERLVLMKIRKGLNKEFAAGAKLTDTQLHDLVSRTRKRMLSSIGYIRIGWANAVRDFGGQIRGERTAVSKAGYARYGKGIKARIAKLVAEFTNTSTGSEVVAAIPLQKAIDFKANDMREYLARKLNKSFKAHSAK